MNITGIFLNWKRPQQLKNIIRLYIEQKIFDEIIIWNNSPDTELNPYLIENTIVINPTKDLGMNTRWYAGVIAKNNCILYHDDDYKISKDSIQHVYEEWKKQPEVIHGYTGRIPTKENTYAIIKKNVESEVDIVIGRFMMTHINNVLHMLYIINNGPNVTSIYDKNHQEDIFFSYATMHKNSGTKNRVHKIPSLPKDYVEDEFSVCKRKEHFKDRTDCMRRCQEAFGIK